MNKKLILTGFAIFISLIFLMAPLGAASHSITPATSPSTSYQPDPTLNTNATWATFYHGWNATEYNNGTANTTLNAGVSNYYANPISVNPTDIQANGTLQNEKIGTSSFIWENASAYSNHSTTNDSSYAKITSSNGSLKISGDTSPEASTNAEFGKSINIANFPSNNLQYDYMTFIYGLSGASMTGVNANIYLWNSTSHGSQFGSNIYPGQVEYITENLAQFQKQIGYQATFNTSGAGKTNCIEIYPQLNMPESSTTQDYTLTIYGMAFTSYAMDLGTNSTGQVAQSLGNAQLQHFAPSFPYQKIIDNGYSVALSASPNNLTQVQTPLASGNYIEQVQYSGTFGLPSAPDLSYSASNITFPLTVPASQVQVLTLGGTSYINSLGNKSNGTAQLVSGINPTSSTSFYAIVDYTASQWQSISHPAGFFTYDGIAYYYWLAIGAIASLLALGVGVRHAQTKREQTEKVDRITRRGR